VSHDRRAAGRAGGRSARALAALLLSLGLVSLGTGCGFDAQLLKPYTPADGTQVDVGADGAVKIRNLVVISRSEAGPGIISATVVSSIPEQLTSLTVAPQKLDGTLGAPAEASLATPLRLEPGVLQVLTDRQPLITVESPELQAGAAATITMQFAESGEVVLNAPVVDGTIPPWSTISPSPTPSRSASPSPSPSGTS